MVYLPEANGKGQHRMTLLRRHGPDHTIVEATKEMAPDDMVARTFAAHLGAEPGEYVLATVHRPENSDDPQRLQAILDELCKLGLPVLFPLHPMTRLAAARHGLTPALDRLQIIPPADHRTFLGLARHARLIVSDSGGMQEECTVLERPLIVVRNSTERPEAIDAGFAHLVQPGPATGGLGRRLIGDRTPGERLAATPCPFETAGPASGLPMQYVLPPSTDRPPA